MALESEDIARIQKALVAKGFLTEAAIHRQGGFDDETIRAYDTYMQQEHKTPLYGLVPNSMDAVPEALFETGPKPKPKKTKEAANTPAASEPAAPPAPVGPIIRLIEKPIKDNTPKDGPKVKVKVGEDGKKIKKKKKGKKKPSDSKTGVTTVKIQ